MSMKAARARLMQKAVPPQYGTTMISKHAARMCETTIRTIKVGVIVTHLLSICSFGEFCHAG